MNIHKEKEPCHVLRVQVFRKLISFSWKEFPFDYFYQVVTHLLAAKASSEQFWIQTSWSSPAARKAV
jgi:hypothetical protein